MVKVLEDDLIRVCLLKDGDYRLNRTWAIAPAGDVPWEGRPRDDVSGFTCPDFALNGDRREAVVLETDTLRLTVETPLALVWEARPQS